MILLFLRVISAQLIWNSIVGPAILWQDQSISSWRWNCRQLIGAENHISFIVVSIYGIYLIKKQSNYVNKKYIFLSNKNKLIVFSLFRKNHPRKIIIPNCFQNRKIAWFVWLYFLSISPCSIDFLSFTEFNGSVKTTANNKVNRTTNDFFNIFIN